MRGRQIAEQLWTWLNGTAFLICPLLAVGLISLLTLWLPQSPVALAETAAFSRWVASVHTRLDPYTERLATWGLLSLKTTLWLRLPLALLALVLMARATTLRERWSALARLTRARKLLLLAGLLCLLGGWVTHLRWGWSEAGIHAWPGESVELSRSGISLPAVEESRRFQWREFGLFLFQEELALGLNIQARNGEGDVVPLLLSSQSAAQQRLRLILNSQLPDGYFGIPEADLVFRVTLLQSPPEPEFHVQIYRSSSGVLLTETVLRSGGVIFADKLQLQLNSLAVPQWRAVYNPGAPITFAGWGLLVIAGIMSGIERRRGSATHREAPFAVSESGV